MDAERANILADCVALQKQGEHMVRLISCAMALLITVSSIFANDVKMCSVTVDGYNATVVDTLKIPDGTYILALDGQCTYDGATCSQWVYSYDSGTGTYPRFGYKVSLLFNGTTAYYYLDSAYQASSTDTLTQSSMAGTVTTALTEATKQYDVGCLSCYIDYGTSSTTKATVRLNEAERTGTYDGVTLTYPFTATMTGPNDNDWLGYNFYSISGSGSDSSYKMFYYYGIVWFQFSVDSHIPTQWRVTVQQYNGVKNTFQLSHAGNHFNWPGSLGSYASDVDSSNDNLNFDIYLSWADATAEDDSSTSAKKTGKTGEDWDDMGGDEGTTGDSGTTGDDDDGDDGETGDSADTSDHARWSDLWEKWNKAANEKLKPEFAEEGTEEDKTWDIPIKIDVGNNPQTYTFKPSVLGIPTGDLEIGDFKAAILKNQENIKTILGACMVACVLLMIIKSLRK